jgi:hypothetical protein
MNSLPISAPEDVARRAGQRRMRLRLPPALEQSREKTKSLPKGAQCNRHYNKTRSTEQPTHKRKSDNSVRKRVCGIKEEGCPCCPHPEPTHQIRNRFVVGSCSFRIPKQQLRSPNHAALGRNPVQIRRQNDESFRAAVFFFFFFSGGGRDGGLKR